MTLGMRNQCLNLNIVVCIYRAVLTFTCCLTYRLVFVLFNMQIGL